MDSCSISVMAKTPRDNVVQFVLKDKDARDSLQVLFDRFPGRETDSHVYRKIFDLGMRALATAPAMMNSGVNTTPTPDELRSLLAAADADVSMGTTSFNISIGAKPAPKVKGLRVEDDPLMREAPDSQMQKNLNAAQGATTRGRLRSGKGPTSKG